MRYNSFFKQILLVVIVLFFVSCDKDYNEIGSALIGDNNFTLSKYTSNVVAYNEAITPVQSNNLPINGLGIYKNPGFGTTTASFATQVTLASVGAIIGVNPEIESVYLDVPYFSTLLSTDATSGDNVYKLDSIYGAKLAKIKLSVYESGFYMRDVDPVGGLQAAQKYFTDQNTDFDNYKKGSRLNDDADVAQNDAFFFDPAEHKVTTTDASDVKTITRTLPSMRLKLNTTFFKEKILEAPAGKLKTNEVFKEYFRGLYFKVEQSGSDAGSMAMMNFANGTITIKYKEDLVTTTTVDGVATSTTTRVDKSIALNMKGNTATGLTCNTVSLLENSDTKMSYANALSSPNRTTGDDKLYLKGGEGSLAVINLFGPDADNNGVADELETIRNSGWLINQAYLVFNIDAGTMANSYEPDRIYLYDFRNSRPIVDYYADGTASSSRPKTSKFVFDGNLNRDSTSTSSPKRGLTYKIRITNHIRNLVKYKDSTNVKLAIAVTESIDIANSYKLKTSNAFISQAPAASVMSPLGTILYGGTTNTPENKRVKLEIYYTKPN